MGDISPQFRAGLQTRTCTSDLSLPWTSRDGSVKIAGVAEWPNHRATRRRLSPSWFHQFYRASSRDLGSCSPKCSTLHGRTPACGGEAEKSAFGGHSDSCISAPILVFPDETRPFRVEADSSDFATGAVLTTSPEDDKWHPVAYYSKSLSAWSGTTRSMTRKCWQSSELWRTGADFWKVLTMRLKSGRTQEPRVLHVGKETQTDARLVVLTCPGLISPCITDQVILWASLMLYLVGRTTAQEQETTSNVTAAPPGVLRNTRNPSPLRTVIVSWRRENIETL